jgi:ADP-ribose pyrophosphatase YjhB (NUDIX family)
MNISSVIAILDEAVCYPHLGLPDEVFQFISRVTPLVNVDLLVKDDAGRTLLTWRDDEFYGAGWHVPGGIIRYKELSAERIRAVAHEELGAVVSFDPAPISTHETFSEERVRGHFISMLYRCKLVTPPDPSRGAVSEPPRRGEWRWHNHCPPDILPVHQMYAKYI